MNNNSTVKKVLPYVYRCVEKDTGRFYIGYRFKNTVPAQEDFGVNYFTSNQYVQDNFANFTYEIISEFPDKTTAFQFETQLIKETSCELQINFNKHNKKKRPYQKNVIHTNCLLPECGKQINSSIKRFCCRTHAGRYSALKKHGKII